MIGEEEDQVAHGVAPCSALKQDRLVLGGDFVPREFRGARARVAAHGTPGLRVGEDARGGARERLRVLGGTRIPSRPSVIVSRIPGTSEATHGRPEASASRITFECPSTYDGSSSSEAD